VKTFWVIFVFVCAGIPRPVGEGVARSMALHSAHAGLSSPVPPSRGIQPGILSRILRVCFAGLHSNLAFFLARCRKILLRLIPTLAVIMHGVFILDNEWSAQGAHRASRWQQAQTRLRGCCAWQPFGPRLRFALRCISSVHLLPPSGRCICPPGIRPGVI
jgi:hypothetical protein